ncbi:uncharacterized protein [Battus philenor]|uniref:uncharacterized protein n=1 Tax=Battus philenor TaxID=42288 RepID=UPI0035D00954
MNGSVINKKIRRPKRKIFPTSSPKSDNRKNEAIILKPPCPLLPKDSEWVDILATSGATSTYCDGLNEEKVLQQIDCENGLEKKPLAILFPSLLEKDPQTLKGVLNRAMSTTEVTKHLVDLGQKANFSFMKKTNRLIPCNKKWMESLMEDKSQSNHSHETKIASEDELINQVDNSGEASAKSNFW